MTKLLVLGGRFAALTAAYTAKRLLGNKIDITLINDKPYAVFRPNLPHVALGLAKPEELEFDLKSALSRKGINFINGKVVRIDANKNAVYYLDSNGKEHIERYDYLIVGFGAKLGVEKIKGFNKYGYSVCEPEYALKLYNRLKEFKGGNIAIGSGVFYQGSLRKRGKYPESWAPKADSACEGPVFEMSIMLPPFLKRLGVYNKTHITIFTPGSDILTDLSESARRLVRDLYKKMGYELVTDFRIKEIREKEIISEDGKKIKADIAIVLPPYEANDVAKSSTPELFDDAGFGLTDEHMRSISYDNIYFVGDANQLTVPKLGALAVFTARIAAEDLANRLGVNVKIESYDPKIYCIADNPLENTGVEVVDNTLFNGGISRVTESKAKHMAKSMLYKYFIWTKGDMALDQYFEQ
ncbi:MAG: sulfide-quinone reductase [Candidatus Micrarchaeota archaeon]|nr:MAG: sulfide-quinone reductase [Candidatus Micrarchaeota archaeon]